MPFLLRVLRVWKVTDIRVYLVGTKECLDECVLLQVEKKKLSFLIRVESEGILFRSTDTGVHDDKSTCHESAPHHFIRKEPVDSSRRSTSNR
jgi:hypothetical protein